MRWMWGLLACVMMWGGAVAPLGAEALPMLKRASLLGGTGTQTPLVARSSPSLFSGTSGKSLFAQPSPRSAIAGPRVGPVTALRSLIAQAEAGSKGYDAVQYGADILPDGPPTSLTLQEIYDWIDDTPGQPHAIGRYQFIPPTLRRLVARLDVPPTARFTPRLQDRLADVLLAEAGLYRFVAGEMPRHTFMNNLAKIWAGLPNYTGKSHYHGYAGNKATMTWAHFDSQMAQIFPG